MSSAIDRARVAAADRLLSNDGNVIKALEDLDAGGLKPDELKAYVLPNIVEQVLGLLPWPLKRNRDLVARLAGRVWGIVAGAAIVAVEADRAGARARALDDVVLELADEVRRDLYTAASILPVTDPHRSPDSYTGAARAGALIRRALNRGGHQ